MPPDRLSELRLTRMQNSIVSNIACIYSLIHDSALFIETQSRCYTILFVRHIRSHIIIKAKLDFSKVITWLHPVSCSLKCYVSQANYNVSVTFDDLEDWREIMSLLCSRATYRTIRSGLFQNVHRKRHLYVINIKAYFNVCIRVGVAKSCMKYRQFMCSDCIICYTLFCLGIFPYFIVFLEF